MIRYSIYIGLFITIVVGVVFADIADVYLQANTLYAAGDYSNAARAFQTVINSGYTDSMVYAQLAHCYYQCGNAARAVLWYERAFHADPTKMEYRRNAVLIRKMIVRDGNRRHPLRKYFYSVFELLAASWCAGVLLVSIWIGFIILSVIYLQQQGRWKTVYRVLIIIIVITIGFSGISLLTVTAFQRQNAAIVLNQTKLLSSPGKGMFIGDIMPTTKVIIISSRDGWYFVRIPGQDESGWLPDMTIARINENL